MDILEKEKFIYGSLFLLSNKLHIIGNKPLGGEMTISQWFLTVAIARFGDTPPTLNSVSEFMGSSHQNVKQLAEKLSKNGFLNIEKDAEDLRQTRLVLTEKCFSFWQERQIEIISFLSELFDGFSSDDIDCLQYCLNKLYEGIIKMEKKT